MKGTNRFFNVVELIKKSFKMSRANYVTLIASSLVTSAKSIFEMFIPAFLVEIITNAGAFDSIMIAITVYATGWETYMCLPTLVLDIEQYIVCI